MSIMTSGLPAGDPNSAGPDSAARLRGARTDLASRAVAAALARDPGLRSRYDERTLRLLLRDCERHLEVVARALESGSDAAAAAYADSIVPVMRRRGVSLRDVATLFVGLADEIEAEFGDDAAAGPRRTIQRMVSALDRPAHLSGDRPRGRLAGWLWKAAGFGGW